MIATRYTNSYFGPRPPAAPGGVRGRLVYRLAITDDSGGAILGE
jgi:hypothetical protein